MYNQKDLNELKQRKDCFNRQITDVGYIFWVFSTIETHRERLEEQV